VLGGKEIPQVLARGLHGGVEVGGFSQVVPPSVLRQIPPPLVVRLSSQADAMTTRRLLGINFTSDIRKGWKESM
jgi:hypothetical protein